MNRFIIEFQNGEKLADAGTKASADISTILVENGYRKLFFKTCGGSLLKQISEIFSSSIKLIVSAKRGSLVIYQYPIYSKKGIFAFQFVRALLRMKGCRVVAFIHDLISARSGFKQKEEEVAELNKNDMLIVHSPQMEAWLKYAGCHKPCVKLGLFDYLVGKSNESPRSLSYTITYAGILSNSKSGFIYQLKDITRDSQIRFLLYGRNDSKDSFGEGIEYSGLFSPDDVSSLQGSWGLVWDGSSIDDLEGQTGVYQKINSPHKASLYLVAGLPLIVSSQAATAKIVVDNKLGITVNSLADLEKRISSVTEEDYADMIAHVNAYAKRLKTGQNLLTVLDQIV